MADGYVDVEPDVVSTAGHATAATSAPWAQWASRVETLLREVAAAAREPAVAAALEGHLSQWNPRLQGLAASADALGTNAVSASTVMLGSDATATAALSGPAAADHTLATHLSRPLTPH